MYQVQNRERSFSDWSGCVNHSKCRFILFELNCSTTTIPRKKPINEIKIRIPDINDLFGNQFERDLPTQYWNWIENWGKSQLKKIDTSLLRDHDHVSGFQQVKRRHVLQVIDRAKFCASAYIFSLFFPPSLRSGSTGEDRVHGVVATSRLRMSRATLSGQRRHENMIERPNTCESPHQNLAATTQFGFGSFSFNDCKQPI